MAAEEIKRVSASGDNYYKILGVGKDAGDDEIKKAYRKLALKLHPDKCQESGAEEAFKKVGEAFGVLSDADKRQQYDQFGVNAVRGGGGGGGPQMSPEDIFQAFFGGAAGGHPFMNMRTSGMGGRGGPRVVFSSGGLGGGNVFHFSTMGGGPGGFGPGMRRRGPGGPQVKQQQRQEEEDDKEEELPAWIKALQGIAGGLGPLLPIFILMVMMVGMALLSTILRFVMKNAFVVFPIMYLTEGRTKLYMLGGVALLGMAGVL